MGSLRRDLSEHAEELRETHISLVFLRGSDVLKVKKPVALGFLDFSTLDARRKACEAELRLNRRLAPDVYLGLLPITRDAFGRHTVDGDGETVDWAVHMRRLPDDARADALLESDRLTAADVDCIAEHIALFHRDARADDETARHGTRAAVARNVRENFEQTRETIVDYLSAAETAELERWQMSFLDEHGDVFDDRAARGRVRDGHGDLRLEHVYLDGRLIHVIDCIEFNDRFRYADVCADIAFLSMDLTRYDRVDLAERLLAVYARTTNDYDLYALVDFFQSYRAHVRGKVTSMLAADGSADLSVRDRAREEARRYYRLAVASERPPLVPPMVIAVGGVIASGKSTVADHLSYSLGGPAINTDWVRKHMAGATPTTKLYEDAWAGAYDPMFTERVYEEVLRFSRTVLRSGRPVVVDASFRDPSMRLAVRRLAEEENVPFRFVECYAEPELLRERLRRRERESSVSDGRLEIFDAFLKKWKPVTELAPDEHLRVDTARSLEETLEGLRSALPTW